MEYVAHDETMVGIIGDWTVYKHLPPRCIRNWEYRLTARHTDGRICNISYRLEAGDMVRVGCSVQAHVGAKAYYSTLYKAVRECLPIAKEAVEMYIGSVDTGKYTFYYQ